MAGKEKIFENQIKKYLTEQGIYALGTPSDKMKTKAIGYFEKRWGGGMFVKAGLPDLSIVIKGKSLEVEIKQDRGVVSELQKFMIKQINESGGKGIIVYPCDFNDFKKIVEGLINDNLQNH